MKEKKYKTYKSDKTYYKIKFLDYLKKGFFLVLFLLVVNFIVTKSFKLYLFEIKIDSILRSVGIYNEVIPSVSIESNGWNKEKPGSWHVDKSAEWTGYGKAKVTFEVDTKIKMSDKLKDVILVLDISGSMSGSKLAKVKNDTQLLANTILSNNQNQVALITFEDSSDILSYLTNNKSTIVGRINVLTANGNTNYNAALKNVNEVLKTYKEDKNRDLIVLFLTDGFPNINTPNQVGTYQILKTKYPYLTINGIQYEMGKSITKQLKDISDNQYSASMNTLENILFEATTLTEKYENFEIVDYIEDEYFYVKDKNDIKVSIGTVALEPEKGQDKQKITWNLGNNFKTGTNATMDITLTLKDKYLDNPENYYPTNKNEEIKSKLENEVQEEVPSTLTPVLKGAVKVIYDTNPPSDCDSIKDITEIKYNPYENVTKRNDELTCEGYNFKGWYIINEDKNDITILNDDVFIMPEHDVTIRAEWGKVTISKGMEGTVYEAIPLLYDIVERDVQFESGIAKKYTGNTSGLGGGDQNIYYYTGNALEKVNVIFGGFCWQMIRTTQTGGVKLLYNGKPNGGKCNNSGLDQQIEIITEDGKIKSNKLISFNTNYNSPADVGYMYGTRYTSNSGKLSGKYGKSVNWDGEFYQVENTTTLDYPNSTHHYTCGAGTRCNPVRYYFYNNYYILISNEKTVETAIEEMLRTNRYSSTIKGAVDRWYNKYLKENYEKYLENTIFCNDRSFDSNYNSGWNPNGGGTSTYLYFRPTSNSNNLSCPIGPDQLSLKIGLLTRAEALLAGSTLLKTGQEWWLASPYMFSRTMANGYMIETTGNMNTNGVDSPYGARPSVSLRPGIEYTKGDGSKNNPYVILMED